MTRLAAAALVTVAGVSTLLAHHGHKRPSSGQSDALATVIPLDRVSRFEDRPPLPDVKAAHASQGASRPHLVRRARPASRSGITLNWHALAMCESTDNPQAVDPTGTYFGLYQFDEETWYSVGGVGNPADASRAEQTLRARILYGQRGRAPWPVCGVHL